MVLTKHIAMMIPYVSVVMVGLLFLQVSHATTCYETNDNSGVMATVTIYCEDFEVCCGTERNRECCGDDSGDDVGIIIGCVVGLIVLVIIVTIVVCLIKQSKRPQKGAVIKPYPVNSSGVGRNGYQPYPVTSGGVGRNGYQPYPVTSGRVGTNGYQPYQPYSGAPTTRLPPLTHNYVVPPARTAGVPTTLNVRNDVAPSINSGPDNIPPAFNYIPPKFA
ncbi:uncharacterized protein LOC117334461 [Pecten maximus]|uniref:uncharacterized protein LOC117334461 n=1 Tax=Pecten maximus TaxID=6579 RepID=UPI0014581EEA|nr:uncharacterized protein LOC117334461 [Pecten maximus]